MEKPRLKYVGSKNFKGTLIVNFEALSATLGRSPDLVSAFLSQRLQPHATSLTEANQLIIRNMSFSSKYIRALLMEFANHYVVCSSCYSLCTDLHVKVQNYDRRLVVNCRICNVASSIHHDTSTHMLQKLDTKTNPSKFICMDVGETKAILTASDAPETRSPGNAKTNTIGYHTAEVEESEDPMTSSRTSLAEVSALLLLRLGGRHADVDAILSIAQEIIFEKDLSMTELVPLVWEAFISGASHYSIAIEKYASLLKAARDLLVPFDASLLFFGCIEATLVTRFPSSDVVVPAGEAVPRLLKSLLLVGVLDLDSVLGWFDGEVRAVVTPLMGKVVLGHGLREALRGQVFAQCLRDGYSFEVMHRAALNLDAVSDYIKLDFVRRKPAPVQRSATGEWSDVRDDDSSIGHDWMFLEDVLDH